jgi:hypothetical protein
MKSIVLNTQKRREKKKLNRNKIEWRFRKTKKYISKQNPKKTPTKERKGHERRTVRLA